VDCVRVPELRSAPLSSEVARSPRALSVSQAASRASAGMLELQRRGYGQDKAIPSIEMAATGIDSVLAIVGAPGRRQAGCRSQRAG